MDKAYQIKVSYLAILMEIGKADGNTDKWEKQYIDTIAGRLNIPQAEVERIVKNPEKFVTALPDTLSQRIEFFYNLLFIMGINNEITTEEKELCKQIGFKLCFNHELMDDMITIVSKHLGESVPVQEVIDAIIKYQN